MAKLKLPYTMQCPRCKAPLKIRNEKLIGTRVPCPRCKKPIEIVSPDEDGSIPYGVEELPEPEPEPEPTEEELEKLELEKKKARRKALWANARHIASILFLSGLLAFFGWLCYKYILVEGYWREAEEKASDIFPKPQAPK